MIFDLGVSNLQLTKKNRGFSFKLDGPLDMRMSKEGIKAFEVINNYSAEGLPDGLKLDSETGIISGTPTVAGDYAITLTVLDSQSPRPGKIEEEFNIRIENDKPIGSPFTIIEDEGTATFAKDKNDGTYWIINGDKALQRQDRQGKTYSDNTTTNWDAVAVELAPNSENIYRVLLQGQNARDGQAYVSTTN